MVVDRAWPRPFTHHDSRFTSAMATPLRFPRWLEAIFVLALLAPLVLAVLPFEEARFFIVSGAICLAAPLGGLWLGEKRGRTIETRAGLGCLVTLGLFVGYALWAFVISRFFSRAFGLE